MSKSTITLKIIFWEKVNKGLKNYVTDNVLLLLYYENLTYVGTTLYRIEDFEILLQGSKFLGVLSNSILLLS